MKLIACMPVRNEAYVLGLSLRAALMWADEVVVLLHACTDGSGRIVEDVQNEYPDCVTSIVHRHESWTEMAHRQQMLETARRAGATHLAIVDADEILTGNLLEPFRAGEMQMADAVARLGSGMILNLPGYNLRGSINRYHSNGLWSNRWFSTAFEDHPTLSWSGDRFHSREPKGKSLVPYCPIDQGQGGTLHLWGASERRLIAKHRAYRIHERLRFPNKPSKEIELTYSDYRSPEDNLRHWPSMKAWGEPWTFADVPESWWNPYEHLMQYLDLAAEPWQEKWCDEMIALHGREKFAGLSI